MQVRVQRIIAERFLPLLDDVFVAHKTHILRTTAYAGGPACIASVLGQKAKEMNARGACRTDAPLDLLCVMLLPWCDAGASSRHGLLLSAVP
jgi:hypothetical protein